MGGLFGFLYRIRVFLLFLLLEIGSLYLIINNNSYQGITYLSSANVIVSQTMELNQGVINYFHLNVVNDSLAVENGLLRKKLDAYMANAERLRLDTLKTEIIKPQYTYVVGKVINNSVQQINNYLTLNKGYLDGVKPGMGVLSPQGVVGRVKVVSEHFATVTSILHSKMFVSAALKRNNFFGQLRWPGKDARFSSLQYIPRHIKPVVGDTVITSSYGSAFPGGVPIGRVSKISINDNDTYYNIEVKLSTDFSTLSYVYVINNLLQAEQDSLQQATDPSIKPEAYQKPNE